MAVAIACITEHPGFECKEIQIHYLLSANYAGAADGLANIRITLSICAINKIRQLFDQTVIYWISIGLLCCIQKSLDMCSRTTSTLVSENYYTVRVPALHMQKPPGTLSLTKHSH